MKKTLFTIFRISVAIILIGKISNWFMDYSDETNQLLNTGMYTLIGIVFVVGGFIWNNKLTNIIFLICGIYLITMNFIGDFGIKITIGFFCILTPLLIARFSAEETDNGELAEN